MAVTVSTVRRSARKLGLAAAVTATLPLTLTACSPAEDQAVYAAELKAAAGSDFLQLPTEHVYRITDTSLLTPVGPPLSSAIESQLRSAGELTLKDGVITDAELRLTMAGLPEATFTLEQPTVLRREGNPETTVTAVGTVAVGGTERSGISVQLTPTSLSEDTVEFDIAFDVPEHPLLDSQPLPLDEFTAHLVFAAR